MFHTLPEDPSFFALLLKIDQDQANLTRAAGCACGGRLDQDNYPRKPRGCLPEFASSFGFRLSFCCDSCRTRTTPSSVRFLGRRVYLAMVMVLGSSRHAGSNPGASVLAKGLDVPVRTLERWRVWWVQAFVRTPLWLVGRSAFMPPVDAERLPTSLLERFIGDAATRLNGLLRFVRPLTVGLATPRPGNRADHAS